MNERKCPSCGAPVPFNATECKYCGSTIACEISETQQYQATETSGFKETQYQSQTYNSQGIPTVYKSKILAALLAIFLGGFGVHKFYLGKKRAGILYLIFCWTYIPAIIGLIEGIIYLTKSDEEFYEKYVNS